MQDVGGALRAMRHSPEDAVQTIDSIQWLGCVFIAFGGADSLVGPGARAAAGAMTALMAAMIRAGDEAPVKTMVCV